MEYIGTYTFSGSFIIAVISLLFKLQWYTHMPNFGVNEMKKRYETSIRA